MNLLSCVYSEIELPKLAIQHKNKKLNRGQYYYFDLPHVHVC